MSVLAVVVREDASYDAVLRAAAYLAGEASFTVLSVHPAPAIRDAEITLSSPVHETAIARESTKRQIEADLSERSLNAAVRVPVAKSSRVGDDIVAEARKAGATVIVIGTHGRTGLSRLFLGSVAEHVVRHAHCDVHVARPSQSRDAS